MSRTGAGGWLFSLFFAANYQRAMPRPAQKSAVLGMQVSPFLRCYSLFCRCYPQCLSGKDQPVPNLSVINPITLLD
jgi:hypothetical protein